MRRFAQLLVLTSVAACASTPVAATSPTSSSASAAATSGAADVSPSPAASPDRIDRSAAHQLVHDGARLVDVRSEDEFKAGHIDGAVNVPVEEVTAHDFGGKDEALVLYCAHGPRSARAAEALRAHGYTHVYVLGPMSAWGP